MAETFGKYKLMRPLAQGGMAEVWLARQEGPVGFQKVVVLKRVLPHLSKNSEFVKMFLDEARLMARLSHPNVVLVFDMGEENGSYFLAMEYLAGEDLGSVIGRARAMGQRVPSQIAANVIAQVCEGLSYVHGLADEDGQPLNVVHRDVSPSNVLVTYQGAVKLLDFGIAKAEGKLAHTQVGTLKGKYSYMSPEQVQGQPLDARSDVFALGAVLYEVLTGVRLFKRDNEVAAARAIVDEPIAKPSLHRPDLPAEMDDVVMKALARPLAERFQSASEMRAALDHFLAARTYVPPSNQLRDYLVMLFGEEHVRERSRAPVTNPGPGDPAFPAPEGQAPPEMRPPTVASLRRRSNGWRWGVGGVGAMALVGVVGTMAWPWGKAQPVAMPPSPAPSAIAPQTPVATATPIATASPPPTTTTAAAAEESRRHGESASLSLDCQPRCRLFVDGRDTGLRSPIRDLKLRPGKHELKVVNPRTGRALAKSVHLEAGQPHLESVRF